MNQANQSIAPLSTIESANPASPRVRPVPIICLLLVLLTFAAFWRALLCDFVIFDDPMYVMENRYVQQGLTAESVQYAFTTFNASNWHPLTWLSLMLDYEIYGYWPFGFHLTNIVIHALNAVLVFLVLKRATGDTLKAALVAAIWTIHPLRAESVAWVSERKDVLSIFFGLLTILIYVGYAHRRTAWRYLGMFVCMALSLLAKPTLVTLPCVLLLLDYWPLGRFELRFDRPALRRLGWLTLEKLPLLALSVASSMVTMRAQVGSLSPLERWTVPIRLANAAVAYIWYIIKLFNPLNLSVIYQFRNEWPDWQTAGSILLLGLISWVVLRRSVKNKYLIVGWFIYLGTLVPVIGLVQVGAQCYADRYSYFPHLGLLVMVVWGLATLFSRLKITRGMIALAFVAIMGVFTFITWLQCVYWTTSISLFSRALDVEPNNPTAHVNLASALDSLNHTDAAIYHYQQALSAARDSYFVYNNLGTIALRLKQYRHAMQLFRVAIRSNPTSATAYMNLGTALQLMGEPMYAERALRHSIKLNPELSGARYNLGVLCFDAGDYDAAVEHLQDAIRLNPRSVPARLRLGETYLRLNREDDAQRLFDEASALSANSPSVIEELKGIIYRANAATQPAATAPATQPATTE